MLCSNAMEIDCQQLNENDEKSPILPPDDFACLQRGENSRIKYKMIEEAREAYKFGMKKSASKRNHRKYLFGSRYREFFEGYVKFVDVRQFAGSVDLKIKLHNGEETVLKVRDLSVETEMMEVVKQFSETSNKKSVARCHSGDAGKMFAFGFNSRKLGDYVSMDDEVMDIERYSKIVRQGLEKYFKAEIDEIIAADRNQGIVPSKAMGGPKGISAYALVSMDLVNSAHYDLDTSVGLSIFNEKIPGKATNWNFVLPNTTMINGNANQAIAIKLFDGCTIAWDGRKVFHCTSAKNIGEGNHVYGNYWGGKKYR